MDCSATSDLSTSRVLTAPINLHLGRLPADTFSGYPSPLLRAPAERQVALGYVQPVFLWLVRSVSTPGEWGSLLWAFRLAPLPLWAGWPLGTCPAPGCDEPIGHRQPSARLGFVISYYRRAFFCPGIGTSTGTTGSPDRLSSARLQSVSQSGGLIPLPQQTGFQPS